MNMKDMYGREARSRVILEKVDDAEAEDLGVEILYIARRETETTALCMAYAMQLDAHFTLWQQWSGTSPLLFGIENIDQEFATYERLKEKIREMVTDEKLSKKLGGSGASKPRDLVLEDRMDHSGEITLRF